MGGPSATSDSPSRRREFSFLLRLGLSLGQRKALPPIHSSVEFVKLVAAFFMFCKDLLDGLHQKGRKSEFRTNRRYTLVLCALLKMTVGYHGL